MTRSVWRTLGRERIRDISLLLAAVFVVAVSFGAIAVGAGLPVWLPMLMSVVVFAGASQFVFVGILAAGGNPAAAVTASLLVNARLVPLGLAVGDSIGGPWMQRLAGSHLITDETVAFTLAEPDPERRRLTFWVCGIGLFSFWNLGVVLGSFGGTLIGDTDALGLDAAFPAVLLALMFPSLTDRRTRRAVALGVVVALVATPFLPAGVPVLLALVGVVASLGGDAAAAKLEGEPA